MNRKTKSYPSWVTGNERTLRAEVLSTDNIDIILEVEDNGIYDIVITQDHAKEFAEKLLGLLDPLCKQRQAMLQLAELLEKADG